MTRGVDRATARCESEEGLVGSSVEAAAALRLLLLCLVLRAEMEENAQWQDSPLSSASIRRVSRLLH